MTFKDPLKRLLNSVTFIDIPIRKKFLLFWIGCAFWFIVISAVALLGIQEASYRRIIIIALFMALSLLTLFAIWITRAFTRPIEAMIEQIDILSEGDVDLTKKIEILSKDEIGILSARFNKLLDTIHEISSFKRVVEEDDTPEDIYARLGKTIKENFDLNNFIIYEVSNSKNIMRPVYATAFMEGAEAYCNRDILIDCNRCRAKKTGDTVSSFIYPDVCKHFFKTAERNHLCIPMIMGGTTGGVVQFVFNGTGSKEESGEINKKVIKASRYIREAVPVLEAKRMMDTLKDSALRDSLTGLYNRRFLEEYTETLVAISQRRDTLLGLLMCDLDFFKEVNDIYGHNVGDVILKETSNVIKESVRTSDMVVRFGGEEFLVILMDVKEGEAEEIAEKIRKTMEDTKVKISRGFVQKTVSIGVSEFSKDTSKFWQAIKYADIGMYKAKDAGRNTVVRFTKDMWTTEEY
ncbi:MAG: sensor domain-containing diguanylate cyclase [Nitrospirae bacterium]|nr:MAG: sensor domain-containing diguanylate cyclase [Nitrospirota bacterium]